MPSVKVFDWEKPEEKDVLIAKIVIENRIQVNVL